MGTLKFFVESMRNLKTVGTITRSGKALCRAVIAPVEFASARNLVELGAGDGVITLHILAAMHKDARLLAFEVNPAFCRQLRAINDDRLIVIEDSAENLQAHMDSHDMDMADAVMSAIPFVSLPKQLADSIVTTCRTALREGAPFCQVHYSLVMKKLYESILGDIHVNFVPVNLPPAFVLTGHKRSV